MCTSSSKSAQIGCGITLLDQQAERLRSPHTSKLASHAPNISYNEVVQHCRLYVGYVNYVNNVASQMKIITQEIPSSLSQIKAKYRVFCTKDSYTFQVSLCSKCVNATLLSL